MYYYDCGHPVAGNRGQIYMNAKREHGNSVVYSIGFGAVVEMFSSTFKCQSLSSQLQNALYGDALNKVKKKKKMCRQ